MTFTEPSWFYEPPPKFQHKYTTPILLFLATLVSTTLVFELFFVLPQAEVFQEPFFGRLINGDIARLIMQWDALLDGILFSTATLTILFCHEMGHYLTCRRYQVDATLPYFIPFPLGIGTLGAFIRIKEPIPSKRQLFDIGANGPIAGFVATLPFLALGVYQSRVVPLEELPPGDVVLGPSIAIVLIITLLVKIPDATTLLLHPFAVAGWVGLLATSLNLLPFGQLDGGHILYATAGRRQHRLALPLYILLFGMGLLWPGWWLWAIILLFIGIRHPRMWDEAIPLDRRRKWIALLVLVIFLLSFMPIPVGILPPA